jgi:integrase
MKGTITKYITAGSSRPKWRYRLFLGRDENGKQRRDGAAGFAREADAAAAMNIKIAELTAKENNVAPPPSTEITVAMWLTDWLENNAAQECEHSTVARYRQLAGYITAADAPKEMIALAAMPLANVRRSQVKLALRALKKAKAIRRAHLSESSVKHVRGLLSSAFSAAADQELVTANPLLGMKLKGLSSGQRKKARSLTEEEIQRLRAVCLGDWTLAPVEVKLASGIRRGELLGLQWSRLNWTTRELTIAESLEQTKEHGIQVKSTKGRESRTIKLGSSAIATLRFHREQQAEHQRLFGRDYRADLDLIFCEPNGDYLDPALFSQVIARRMKKAKISGASAHSLRHTHATHLLSRGVPLATVSERLGHKDQMTTLRIYSHALPRDANRAAEAWDSVITDIVPAEAPSTETRRLV